MCVYMYITSYVDDLQSASGLSEPPIPQKIFW